MNDLVSVLLTSYNNDEYIADAISSVLNQSYQNLELLIIDDGSDDQTDNIVSSFNDERITYYKNDYNIGYPAPNRNKGIQNAKGNYIALIDADDVWKKTKLEKQMNTLLQKDVLAVSTNYIVKYERKDKAVLENNYEDTFYITLDALIRKNLIANSSVLFRKTVIDEIGSFCEDRNVIEDYDFWLRLTALKPKSIIMLSEPLIYYRVHDTMTSKKNFVKKWRRLKAVYENNKKFIKSTLLEDRIRECDNKIEIELIKEDIEKRNLIKAIKAIFRTNNHKLFLYKRLIKKVLGQ